MADPMTPERAREVLARYRNVACVMDDTSDFTAALTHALATIDAVKRVRALITTTYADVSPLLDREAIRQALDGEATDG